ncbi:MAG: PASTA domain-containing protein [Bacteroidetes bacterium]|nr:PASTA domain-containing protein [Bacteroidota bacterium]
MAGKLKEFFTSKTFLINAIIALVFVMAAFGLLYNYLDNYTHHGESISVPDLRGLKKDRLESFISDKHLRYAIVDSIFELDKPPGTVVEQDPSPDSKVKEDRTIYLTVNASLPPKVKMPDLIDVSYRQAEAILSTFGLKVGTLIYKPDLAKNAVLGQHYRGNEISPGTSLPKGSVIDLVLGDGLGNTKVPVPDLIGRTKGEALFVLKASSLNVGTLFFDHGVRDSSAAKVYKQIPQPSDSATINEGEAVDLYLR